MKAGGRRTSRLGLDHVVLVFDGKCRMSADENIGPRIQTVGEPHALDLLVSFVDSALAAIYNDPRSVAGQTYDFIIVGGYLDVLILHIEVSIEVLKIQL